MKVCLSDRDAGLVCFVAGVTISDALDAAERALTDPGADWRVQRQRAKSTRPTKGLDGGQGTP